MILTCACQHEYQDKLYGAGKRVHNSCKKGSSARCSVCGKEKSTGEKAKEIIKENRK